MRLKGILHNQSGRSLIEILAVLAIMGILSLAAVYGIRYAMELNRENETLNRFSKVVAGSRTSRILETQGDKTLYNQNTGDKRVGGYEKMAVDMNDVISNLGEDLYVSPATDVDGKPAVDSYIVAPLKGPVDNQGNKENVKIYVYVETPNAFTVHADNLTFGACMKIVQANLGYTFTYETAEDTSAWRVPSQVQTDAGARALCEKVVYGGENGTVSMNNNPFARSALAATKGSGKAGTLVMWFGPYACMGDGCTAGMCNGSECCCDFSDSGRQVSLKNPAPVGCKPAAGGCIDCATPDAKGICMPKSGITNCEPKCPVNICQNSSNPYYCGNNLCCPSAEMCGNGSCTGKPPVCSGDRPTVCGTQCCSTDETCTNGICEPTGVCSGTKLTCLKQTDNSFSHCCNQDETCCGTTCCGINQTCNDLGVCVSDNECTETTPGYCAPGLCCDAQSKCENGTCVPVCAAGETLYCKDDKPGSWFVLAGSAPGCRIFGSECDEYVCTKNKLILKDPNEPKKRAAEVPIDRVGYSYCAYEMNRKCAVVTYCDDKPIKREGAAYLELCPSCTPVNTSIPSNFWNPFDQVCQGNKIVAIASLKDKKDALLMYTCDNSIVPPPGGPVDTDNDCNNPCPGMENFQMTQQGCCDLNTSVAWTNCSHCHNSPVYTDSCGKTYPIADVCCPPSPDADGTCKSPKTAGKCLINFPDNKGNCCPLACLNAAGEDTCCTPADVAADGLTCCDADTTSKNEMCCTHKNRDWCDLGNGHQICCEDGDICHNNQCKGVAQTCTDLGGVPGYGKAVPGNEAVGGIEGCCPKDRACPTECCKVGKSCLQP